MDEELFGLRIHKYSHGNVRIPEHETHSTLIDSVISSARELSEKINILYPSDGDLIQQIDLLIEQAERLKISMANRFKDWQVTDAMDCIQNFFSEFRGLFLVALHLLDAIRINTKTRGKAAIDAKHERKVRVLRTLFELSNELSQEREVNEHRSNHFPFSTRLNIDDYKCIIELDTRDFMVEMGNHYLPRVRFFFNLMVRVTASHHHSIEFSKTHSNESLVKQATFGLSNLYYFVNGEAAADKAINFFTKVNPETGRSMWELLDSPIIRPFHYLHLPHVLTSEIFNVPSFINNGDVVVEPVQETESTEDIEGVISVTELNFHHAQLNKSSAYKSHRTHNVPLRLISDIPLESKLAVSTDYPTLYETLRILHSWNPWKVIKDPIECRNRSIIFHIHGGGFVSMSSLSHEPYLRLWAKNTHVPIVSVDYSKAPESKYPVQVEECYSAYKWVVENAIRILGKPLHKIVIAGDSAGGNLSLALTMKIIQEGYRMPDGLALSYPATYVSNAPSPARLISLVDPLVNFSFLRMCTLAYADVSSNDPARDPFLSPAVAPNEYLCKFPPTYFAVGTMDPLFDDTMVMARRINACNGGKVRLDVVDGLGHGYLNMTSIVPEAVEASKRLEMWVTNIIELEAKV
jgi:acetyl esterase/lipase